MHALREPEPMTFEVRTREVYESAYEIEATSPEEALEIAQDSSLQSRSNTTLKSRKLIGLLDSGEVRDMLPDGSNPVLIEAS